jgi:hypothetical protein
VGGTKCVSGSDPVFPTNLYLNDYVYLKRIHCVAMIAQIKIYITPSKLVFINFSCAMPLANSLEVGA